MKKVPEVIESSESEYPKRSLLHKTALLSGFELSFLPTSNIQIVKDWRKKFDVLVMKKFVRTFKLLYAICLGVPIVSYNWILESEYRRGVVGLPMRQWRARMAPSVTSPIPPRYLAVAS
jgi:hypothetical protein